VTWGLISTDAHTPDNSLTIAIIGNSFAPVERRERLSVVQSRDRTYGLGSVFIGVPSPRRGVFRLGA